MRIAAGTGTRRHVAVVLGLSLLLGAVGLPALAADPSPTPGEPEATRPVKPGKSEDAHAARAEKARAKADRAPAVDVTLRGAVSRVTDADGHDEYRLTVGGTTYVLDAGPRWYHGDRHPLRDLVGTTVTITGSQREGSTEVDVAAVDGTALRGGGTPPWAGGWKRVGEAHPGWSAEKAERHAAKHGDCWPPGHCRRDAAADGD